MGREEYIVKRIEMIQGELEDLKTFISGNKENVTSLRGIWKGVNIPDKQIEEAKRSLSKGIEVDDSN